MAYQVDRFNGTFLVSVEDGTIDTSTDIRFVGKNYAGYGEVQNENFLHLLENFANTSAPPKAISGQIWYDSGTKKLKFYDGNRFKFASGAEFGTTAPSGLTQGDFWFNSSTQQLYCWSGTDFILIGPEAAPEFGASTAVGVVVFDNNETPRPIIKLIVGDDTVAVISKESFTLSDANQISGFNLPLQIKAGITLINTDPTTGITSSSHRFQGTASNSLRLGGFEVTDFVRSDQPELPAFARFEDSGFYVGRTADHLYVFYDTQDALGNDELRDEDQIVLWSKEAGQPITLRIQQSEGTAFNVAKVRATGIFPGNDNIFSLGSSDNKWADVYASNIVGSVTGNIIAEDSTVIINKDNKTINGTVLAADLTTAFNPQTKTFFGTLGSPSDRSLVYGDIVGDVTGSADSANSLGIYQPSVTTVADTVAIRNASGDLSARFFLGISTFTDRLKIDDTATDTDPLYRSAKTTATASSIAARDSSGNLTAILFNGTATAARYADLAEKYLPDSDYEQGTVVSIGGEAEVTESKTGDRAIGVVSSNPAFMMNKDLEGGIYIALKGRVPVKVKGPVKKGDRLVAHDGGTAVSCLSSSDVFAISMEENLSSEIKLIEAVIL
jgi:hypothetical protein